MTRKPTAYDVAQRAQVSRTVVSLVLSGQGAKARLSAATQERVRRAVDELNYRPDATGRSLKRGRSDTIGLVIRDIGLLDADPYLLPLLNGILARSRMGAYRVIVESARGDNDGDSFGELMDSGRIDGMIVENPDYDDPSLARLIEAGRPVVVLGTKGLKGEFSVASDDLEVGRLATRHLASIGRRRIAHITYAEPGIYGVDQRLAGYRDALREAGLDIDEGRVVHGGFSMSSGYDAMKRLLEIRPALDAVFAGSDAIAIGAMAAAKDGGLAIPDDLAVIGVDDIAAAAFCRPSLTTVTNIPFEAGRFAADMLIDLLSGRTPPQRNVFVPSTLIVRQSTSPSVAPGRPSPPPAMEQLGLAQTTNLL